MTESHAVKKELSLNQFTHDGVAYDLTKVRIMTQGDPTYVLSIRHLLWVLEYDIPREDRVRLAKLRYPLLVTKDTKDGKPRYTVLDGLHRLERYRRRGITSIPVRYVSAAILRQCMVS